MSVDLVFRYDRARFFAIAPDTGTPVQSRFSNDPVVMEGVFIPGRVSLRVKSRLSFRVIEQPQQYVPSGIGWRLPVEGQLFPRSKVINR